MNAAKRFVREKVTGDVFEYDPTFIDPAQPWKRKEDGCIIVGPEQVRAALKYADAFGTPEAATAIGLSKAYIVEHFPEALEQHE